MKFVILGDLQGYTPKIYFKDFDAIMASGDFCSGLRIRKILFQYWHENKY